MMIFEVQFGNDGEIIIEKKREILVIVAENPGAKMILFYAFPNKSIFKVIFGTIAST